jgi:photosystem II stability/assembly factor-like uncharacterized protein
MKAKSILPILSMLFVFPAVASAQQWTRVLDIPATNIYSLRAQDDTLLAGTKSVVYVSLDGGATWRASNPVSLADPVMQTALMRNGRLYVGTGGLGVFFSDDRGASWHAFNEGLVGGFLDTQLDVADLALLGDDLYASTFGDGVWVRNLSAGTWHRFGGVFEENQASNVVDLESDGKRVVASAGGNGSVFRRDTGEAEWTISWLDNVGLRPGLMAFGSAFNGNAWVVGTLRGVFRSTGGQEPWSLVDPGLGPLNNATFAVDKRTLFAAFDIPNLVVIEDSFDDGATWTILDVLPQAFVFRLAKARNALFAARTDGLWQRSLDTVAVPAAPSPGLRFLVDGRQPVGDNVRLHFDLPAPAHVSIALYDVRGRRVAPAVTGDWPAGAQVVSFDTHSLRPGVYEALLVAGGKRAVARIVRER